MYLGYCYLECKYHFLRNFRFNCCIQYPIFENTGRGFRLHIPEFLLSTLFSTCIDCLQSPLNLTSFSLYRSNIQIIFLNFTCKYLIDSYRKFIAVLKSTFTDCSNRIIHVHALIVCSTNKVLNPQNATCDRIEIM